MKKQVKKIINKALSFGLAACMVISLIQTPILSYASGTGGLDEEQNTVEDVSEMVINLAEFDESGENTDSEDLETVSEENEETEPEDKEDLSKEKETESVEDIEDSEEIIENESEVVSEETVDENEEKNEIVVGEVSRREWLQTLLNVFFEKEEIEFYPENYFSDITEDSEDYDLVMDATYYGLVDTEPGDPILLDSAVTREYAAASVVALLGYENEKTYTFSDAESVKAADAAQVALDRNWFSLISGEFAPDTSITAAEKTAIFNDVAEIISRTKFDANHENTYSFKTTVKVLSPDLDKNLTADKELTIYDETILLKDGTETTIEVGDIIGTEKYGIPAAWKVASVNETEGKTVLSLETIPSDLAFDFIDIQSDVSIPLSEVGEELEKTASVLYIVGGTKENDYNDGTVCETLEEVGEQKVNALSVTNYFSVDKQRNLNAEEIEEYEELNRAGSNPIDATTYKYSFKITSSDLKVYHSASKKICSVKAIIGFQVDFSVKVDLLKAGMIPSRFVLVEFPLCEISWVEITLNLSLEAKITFTYEGKITVGFEYDWNSNDFRMIHKFTGNPTITGEVVATIELEARITVCVFFAEGYVYAKAGVTARFLKVVKNDGGPDCKTFYAWFHASVGAKVTELITGSKKSFEKKYTIYDLDKTPWQVYRHYEGSDVTGHYSQVPECSRGEQKEEVFKKNVTKFRSNYDAGFAPLNSARGYKYSGGVATEVVIFTYKLDNENKATITGYNGDPYSLNIPAKLDGYDVVAIDNMVFKSKARIRTVVMPDTLKKIGYHAFDSCVNLRSVVLPANLEEIDYGVFKNCTSLTSINIPKSLKKAGAWNNVGGVFQNTGLKYVTFEEGITSIPENLFGMCESLTNITIPDTVTEIGKEAFYYTGLTEITIPDSVTLISTSAFNGCTNLNTVKMGNGVKTVKTYAFNGCTNLENVELSKNLETLEYAAFQGCSKLNSIWIPKSLITSDRFNDSSAVFKDTNLEHVTFEAGTTAIPKSLFACCQSLKQIEIPDTVTEIKEGAFYKSGLTSVVIPDGVKIIGREAFRGCVDLSSVTIGSSVTGIQEGAFENDEKLTSIVIPDSVTIIGSKAFLGCTALNSVTLSKRLESLYNGAFQDCKALIEIEIPKSLKETNRWNDDYGIFKNSGLKKVTFEPGRTEIPEAMFALCGSIEEITIPDTVTVIKPYAFYKSGITKITIPNSVEEIGRNAFYECTSLEEVTLGNGLKTIRGYAFALSSSLKSIVIPESVTTLEPNTFAACYALTEATVNADIEKLPNEFFYNCTGLQTVVLSDHIKTINNSAFEKCEKLTSVTLPAKLDTIGNYTFKGCKALETIVMPATVRSIGTEIFSGCIAIKNVTLGSRIQVIPANAFLGCDALEEIVLPNSVTTINNYAFKNCSSLTSITLLRNVETIGTGVFSYPTKLTINGVAGTFAQSYAQENSIHFNAINKPATSVKFLDSEVHLINIYGNSIYLGYEVKPSDFTDELGFKSMDKSIATVDINGKVTAVSVGSCKVKIYVGDDLVDECTVYVEQGVNNVYITPYYIDLDPLDEYQAVAEIYPADAYNKKLKWESNDETVAIVDENGLITALSGGNATITASSTDGTDEWGYINVRVNENVTVVTDISTFESAHNYTRDTDHTWKYKIKDAEYLNVTFDDKTNVDEDGDFLYIYDANKKEIGKYTGKELAGKTIGVEGDTVSVRLVSDEVINKYGFKVTNVESVVKPVALKSISLSETKLSIKAGSSSEALTVSFDPEKAAAGRVVSWSSSNENVATVKDGIVTAHAGGSCVITAEADGKTATCQVTVTEVVSSVKLVLNGQVLTDSEEITLLSGEPIVLAYKLFPEGAVADTNEIWICDDNEENPVLAFEPDDALNTVNIKALKKGSANVTVTVDGFSASVSILVKDTITLNYGYDAFETGAIQEVAVEYNKPVSALSVKPEREGYVFLGWFTEENGRGKRYTSDTLLEKGVWTLYAQWRELKAGEGALFVAPISDCVYTGKPQTPEVLVYNGNELLVKNVDYTLAYKNNIKAGNQTASVTVTGKGNYSGKKILYFNILPQDIASEEFAADDLYAFASASTAVKPAPVLTYNGVKLKATSDYTVSYPDAMEGAYKNPGTYSVVLSGCNNFTGQRVINLVLTNEKLVSKLSVSKVKDVPYDNGNAIEPELVVKDGSTVLTKGVHYDVSYDDNEEVGTAKATIVGLGEYHGYKSITFKIKGSSITKASVTGIPKSVVYVGEEIKFSGVELRMGKGDAAVLLDEDDYYVEYSNNVNPGKATICFVGINEYKGTVLKKTFTITPYNIYTNLQHRFEIADIETCQYSKGGSKTYIKLIYDNEVLKEGVDYTLTYKNNGAINANLNGKIPLIIIKGKGRFTGTCNPITYEIKAKNLGAVNGFIPDVIYSAKRNNYKIAPTLTDLDGKKLSAGKDYDKTVKYYYASNAVLLDGTERLDGDLINDGEIVPAGTRVKAVVNAMANGNYIDSKEIEFRVVKYSLAKATIKIKDQIYTGEEIQITKDDISFIQISKVDVPCYAYEIVEGSYQNNIKQGTASVIIRGIDEEYGGEKKVTFKIQKRDVKDITE